MHLDPIDVDVAVETILLRKSFHLDSSIRCLDAILRGDTNLLDAIDPDVANILHAILDIVVYLDILLGDYPNDVGTNGIDISSL